MKNTPSGKNTNVHIRKYFAKAFIWSTLLYESASWILENQEMTRLGAAALWVR